jgi:hypothetical protein
MTARAFVDPRREMALFHRILIGAAVFFFALLIGIQITRTVVAPSPRNAGEPAGPAVSGR